MDVETFGHLLALHLTSANRDDPAEGQGAFLTRKWAREREYRLIKEVGAARENRIAVHFTYEWHDEQGQWFRSYGNEGREFDQSGLMRRRIASINDLLIDAGAWVFRWRQGGRPDAHSGLSDLGL